MGKLKEPKWKAYIFSILHGSVKTSNPIECDESYIHVILLRETAKKII